MSHLETVRSIYERFAQGDMPAILATFAARARPGGAARAANATGLAKEKERARLPCRTLLLPTWSHTHSSKAFTASAIR
jgi:hypothetical protein